MLPIGHPLTTGPHRLVALATGVVLTMALTAGADVLEMDVQLSADAVVVVWVWPSDWSQENEATYREWIELGTDGIIAGNPAAMTGAVADSNDGASQSGGE